MSSSSRVFIARLGPHVRTKDVEKFFKGYGKIRDIDIKAGFGFVEFDDCRDADDAVSDLNGRELNNERMTVEHARAPRARGDRMDTFVRRPSGPPPTYRPRGGGGGGGGPSSSSASGGRYGPPSRTDHRLVVENLSSTVSWQDLKDYMRQAGEVTFADAHRIHQNVGVVEFATRNDMKNAIDKLNGKEINGRKIKLVEENKRKSSRSRSRSSRSSRSDSRSRSRSRSSSRSRSPRPSRRSPPTRRSRSPQPAKRSRSPPPKRGSGSRSPPAADQANNKPKSLTVPSRSRSASSGE
ncbi:serine/arginine-rich splicing factor 5 isoform X2 [Lethenteron reissneri]|uniref:serine/arginine-rich splicing factor 5 isoform X2 n=1 Tax=Lethenteron reissneri TaxID=7753 RepID=UPI002AB7A27A|nr:serine/arginine-rich splicing factor 5 isoform X2 [Lethenteron reissneri]